VAGAFGVALVATVQINRLHAHQANAVAAAHLSLPTPAIVQHAVVMSYHDAFLLTGVLLLLSGAISLFVSDEKARAAMLRRVRAVSHPEPAGEAPAVVGE
jgi:hypothetical protein